jgi:hypothetical protein
MPEPTAERVQLPPVDLDGAVQRLHDAARVADLWAASPRVRQEIADRYSGLAWALDHLTYGGDDA